MGYSTDAQTIRERFDSEWPVQQPSVPYSFGDVEVDPPDDSPWVRVSTISGEQTQVSMGKLRRFRRVGLVMVQIFVPAGGGDGTARELGDSVAAIYQGRTVKGVIFRGTGLTRIGIDGAWVQYNAATPYQADSLIANPTP
jgi:hypothetical protein